MKIKVDSTKCDAYGICAEVAPQLVELDEFGYAGVRHGGEVPTGQEAAAQSAVQTCPVHALQVLDH